MACCRFGKKPGSPDRNLLAKSEKFHGRSEQLEDLMENTWQIGGTYANWTMTVTVVAPDHLDAADVAEFPVRQFDGLGRVFHDAVNLYECLRYQNDRGAQAGVYGTRVY
jgi:hypothetical protein